MFKHYTCIKYGTSYYIKKNSISVSNALGKLKFIMLGYGIRSTKIFQTQSVFKIQKRKSSVKVTVPDMCVDI
jgi:hypothetical protein